MMTYNKLTVIGSGRRVQQDLIPVLVYLGYLPENISIYSKKEKSIFVRDTFYKVSSIESLNKKSIEDFVYVAIPSKRLFETLKTIYTINPKARVIVDTPIFSSEIVKSFANKNICVAEDAGYLSEYLIKGDKLYHYNILFMDKSAYLYHGIAFIESILDEIIFHFSLFGFYFAFCRQGIAIIRGANNYERGNIYLNFKSIPFPNLNKSEINLIGGLSNHDTVSYRFLDIKRLGLKMLIRNFIQGSGNLISLEAANNQFRKSKMINVYLNTLKKIIKGKSNNF